MGKYSMADENKIVTIEMAASDRLRLDSQINDRMEKLGFGRFNYAELGLGFELPLNWPADMNCQLTLPQLTVIANKLNMRIIIDNLNLVPRREKPTDSEDGSADAKEL